MIENPSQRCRSRAEPARTPAGFRQAPASGNHDQLGFVVDDVETTVVKLRSRGLQLEDYEPPPHATGHGGITNFGAGKAAWLKGSEGNLISVGQFTDGTPFTRLSI